jgi:hypothetical protein
MMLLAAAAAFITISRRRLMLRITHWSLALVLSIALIGCEREEPAEEETMTEDTTAMAPTGIALADVAGTWTMNATAETGEVVPQFELVATASESGWELHFPNRDPVPVRVVEVAGDSIVTEAGPYESILRPGTQVTTHGVYRLEGDRLMGTTTAHFQTTEPDSVLTVRSEGTRAP